VVSCFLIYSVKLFYYISYRKNLTIISKLKNLIKVNIWVISGVIGDNTVIYIIWWCIISVRNWIWVWEYVLGYASCMVEYVLGWNHFYMYILGWYLAQRESYLHWLTIFNFFSNYLSNTKSWSCSLYAIKKETN